jgi:hypothetical protein
MFMAHQKTPSRCSGRGIPGGIGLTDLRYWVVVYPSRSQGFHNGRGSSERLKVWERSYEPPTANVLDGYNLDGKFLKCPQLRTAVGATC